MKTKLSIIFKSIISLTLIMALAFSSYGIKPSVAEGKVTSTERFVGENVGLIDGNYYVLSQSGFMLNYEIQNGTDKNITNIILEETLLDESGRAVPGEGAPSTDFRIDAGQTKTLQGRKFKAQEKPTTYTLEYSILYILEDGDGPHLISSGKKQITVLSTGVSVVYKASTGGPIPPGTEVTYTFEIKSSANININNIVVKDSVLGDIGVIPVLSPGETATVSKAFKLESTTKSHPIIVFQGPIEGQGNITREFKNAAVEVVVEEKQVENPLVITGKTNKTRIAPNEEVDFSLIVENKGNRAITGVSLRDWTGKEILTKDKLEPGKEGAIIYAQRVEPGKEYTFTATGVEEGTGRNVQASYTAKFSAIEAELEITNRVTPEELAVGDTAIIEYTLKNTGKVTMVDVRVHEPEFGEVAAFDELKPGQTETFTFERIVEKDMISHPRVYARDKDSGYEYEFQGELIEIVISGVETHPLLVIRLDSEPKSLAEAGTVDLICTVINEGNIRIDNIDLILNERDLSIGSILTLEPGDEETLTLAGLDIEENTSFTVTARGVTYQGEDVEFVSAPYEITIGGDETPQEPTQNPKISFLKKLLWVVAGLALATVGGMIYLLRDLKRGSKGKKKGKTKKAGVRRRNPNHR
ncbi:MAG: hypothetical protein ACOX1R_10140 [Caldicoprobacterales bacterium]|nr:hypothetical protein [Clostridiales bacterium]